MKPKTFTSIKTIIDQWDSAELLAIHCPQDEYDSEIKKLTLYIQSNESLNEKEFGKYIYKILTEYLGNQFQETEERCLEISKKILEKVCK
ncbi:hypothetical protein [Paenibacillus sanguinis]|uniref:hypothetical protein n=1 Tax=Paenibacillus sanguinis TaxID=225906 RepID=UPI00035E5999|nr:hypothetical protein [Paenibacillus sanguinis]